MEKKSILIIEDDVKIRKYLELELLHGGYKVTLAEDGKIGLKYFTSNFYDLVLLDLMLPEISGEEICKKIRQESDIPILVLTAKDETFSKVSLLDLGADDYLTKPFDIEELFARMRVLFRNKSNYGNKKILKCGKIQLNISGKKCYIENEEIILTKTEYNLLHYLMLNKNIVLTRENILENVWGFDYMGEVKIIDIYIKSLRTKIDKNNNYIKTVRGFGYMFKEEEN